MNVAVDCSTSSGPFVPFWRSVGYTPAEYALRDDELENTLNIGSVPRRGVTQVRIHYLLDLIGVLGVSPSPTTPSGYRLDYDFSALDHAVDFLVANSLSPGFEFMGSPRGFPVIPLSFFTPYSGNGKIPSNQTLVMWRQLIGDTLIHEIGRYGAAEVATWHLESWNEIDVGWGWPAIQNDTDPVLLAYVSHWDAMTAGVEDAEAATGASLYFGGTASGEAARDKYFLPAIFNHYSTGVNAYNGRAVRLDYITAHVKGGSTSYGTVVGEWGVSTLIRSNPTWMAAGLDKLDVSNDEGDPMVGWEVAEDWRSDARYSSIIPKMINQHLLTIADNATTNNPLGLLSFDGAFMNGAGDTYTGFGQRTMTARFGTPDSRGPFAFVKKSGLAAFTLLSRLGDLRCEYSGAPSGSAVLSSNAGVLATLLVPGADPVTGGQATVIVYNSADCANDTAPALDVGVTLTGLPFTPSPADGSVVAVLFVLDQDAARNPAATWSAMNSPPTPSTAQLQELWSTAAAMTAAMGVPLPVSVGAQGIVTLPRTPLALPGVAMWHLAVKGASAPAAPSSLVAYAKAPNASFVMGATEVMVRWDCSIASRAILAYTVQTSTAGPGGPWTVVNGAPYPQDISCTFVHVSPAPAAWYRVAATDYWMRQGNWTVAAATGSWPTAAR